MPAIAPDRLSVDVDSEHFEPLARSSKVRVNLNGAPADRVIEYDRKAGWLKRYKTDASGEYVFNDERDGFKTETVYGVIDAWIED